MDVVRCEDCDEELNWSDGQNRWLHPGDEPCEAIAPERADRFTWSDADVVIHRSGSPGGATDSGQEPPTA